MNRLFDKFNKFEMVRLRRFVRKCRRRGVAAVLYMLWEDSDHCLLDERLLLGYSDDIDLLKETIKIELEKYDK